MELFMVCLSTQCRAVVTYDFQLQGALTGFGGNWQCQAIYGYSGFFSPRAPAKHQSPDTQA